jgi:pimeloyl-ACP methyl ester carboxylesterase
MDSALTGDNRMLRRLILGSIVCLSLISTGLRADEPGPKKPCFDSGGVKIHDVVRGKDDGEPVLLIHGFLGDIDRQWAPQIKALVNDYKVLALDCRGHGASEKPHDSKKYGLEMVKDVARLLDHLKIDKAHIVGYSMGGGIALQFAVRHPERVRSLTVGGAGRPQPGRQQLLDALADSLEQGKGISPLILALTPRGQAKPTEVQLGLMNNLLLARQDTKALTAMVRSGVNNKDLELTEGQVKGIRVPVLALIGEIDPFREEVDGLKKWLPSMKIVVIEKADHITAFIRPEFISALKQFLDEHRPAEK